MNTEADPRLEAVRILVVGDSTAEATGHGLITWAAANPALAQVSLQVREGCGVVLGGYVVWSGKQPVITSVHVMTGAATLALSLVTALTARTIGWRTRRQGAGALLATEVAA